MSALNSSSDADTKVVLASANITNLSPHIFQSTFPPDCHVNLEKNGCIPIFAMYRNKACVSVLVGVDAPQFMAQFQNNFPGKAKTAS